MSSCGACSSGHRLMGSAVNPSHMSKRSDEQPSGRSGGRQVPQHEESSKREKPTSGMGGVSRGVPSWGETDWSDSYNGNVPYFECIVQSARSTSGEPLIVERIASWRYRGFIRDQPSTLAVPL